MDSILRLTVSSHLSLKEALKKLNTSGLGILLIVDEFGKLLRTVTDGDIRRLLLKSVTLEESTLAELPDVQPKVAHEGISNMAALRLMNDYGIDQLPIVDEQGCPKCILHRRDLDSRILLSIPHMGTHELDYIEDAFRSNWIAPLGPNVEAFEHELGAYLGIDHVAALSSGTAALHLALCVLGVRQNDIVFCSSFTFVASASPILYVGAKPVFIDSEPETWNMCPKALKLACEIAKNKNRLPKAVIVANIYGQSADMALITEICDHYKIPIIEDSAESLGGTYQGKYSGTLGKLGVYSFNGNKVITTSGGGALVSEDEHLIKKARFLATQARDPASHYEHSVLGYNYRMSNVLAGIGRGQLKVLEERIAARQIVFKRYATLLKNQAEIIWMPEAPYGTSIRWLTTGVLDPNKTTIKPEYFINRLSEVGIEARRVWKPMHRQPLFENSEYYQHSKECSVSDYLFEQGFCLPSSSNLTEMQQDKVVLAIQQIFSTIAEPA